MSERKEDTSQQAMKQAAGHEQPASKKNKEEHAAQAGEAAREETQQEPSKKYEYLDHTADIQVHAWGDSLKESFEQAVIAMFGYMTELESVEIKPEHTSEFEVSGQDLLSLLFALLDEFLFRFSAEDFLVCKRVEIVELDTDNWKIRVKGYGEPFDLAKHPQGTEIKAITYSNMQIHDDKPSHDVYVILDI